MGTQADTVRRNRRFRFLVAGLLLTGAGLLAVRPLSVAWQLNRARGELREAKIDDARIRLESLAATVPTRADVQYELARAERRCGRIDRAVAALQEAERLGFSNRPIRLQWRLLEAQSGSVGDVKSFIREVSAQQPSDEIAEEIYEALAQGLMFSYRFQDAHQCLEYWLEWKPDRIRPRMWRADILERTTNWDDAIAEYRDIVEAHPEHLKARKSYARLLLNHADVEMALSEFQKCADIDPTDPMPILGTALCYEKLGRIRLARQTMLRALKQPLEEVDRLVALKGLGRIAIVSGDYAAGERYLKSVLKIDPYDPDVHFLMATALRMLDKSGPADRHQKRATQLRELREKLADAQFELAQRSRNAKLRMEVGETLLQLGMKQEALSWFQASAAHMPGEADFRRRIAELTRESEVHTGADRTATEKPVTTDSSASPQNGGSNNDQH